MISPIRWFYKYANGIALTWGLVKTELDGFPGFRYCPSALSEDLQLRLGLAAMREYCQFPHSTNIDLIPCDDQKEYDADETIWELYNDGTSKDSLAKESRPFAKKRRVPNIVHDRDDQRKPYRRFNKLSWSVLGYHYNW